MPKKTIKRLMPDHNDIKNNKHLHVFGDLIHNPNLWHLNRRSVAKAFAVGLFCAFVPIPFQMFLAAGVAIIAHSNLPISIALVWITNPLTMAPIYYFSYLVGAWVLNEPAQAFHFQLSWQWVVESLSTIGPAFLLGCGIVSTVSSLVGYILIQGLWRHSVSKQWKKRPKSPRT